MPKDLNAGDGLTTGPLSDSLEALFSQSRVVEADCTVMKAHHAGIRNWRPLATRRKALMNRKHGGSYPANYGYSARLCEFAAGQAGHGLTAEKRVDTLAPACSGLGVSAVRALRQVRQVALSLLKASEYPADERPTRLSPHASQQMREIQLRE